MIGLPWESTGDSRVIDTKYLNWLKIESINIQQILNYQSHNAKLIGDIFVQLKCYATLFGQNSQVQGQYSVHVYHIKGQFCPKNSTLAFFCVAEHVFDCLKL